MQANSSITHWTPSNILSTDGKTKSFCLIVLNQPIHHIDTFSHLWNNASFRFVADGGSNRLYDAFQHNPDLLAKYLPDEIRGDLDSIRPDVQAYYESKHVKITKVHDQDSTDFMKCVALLHEKEKEQGMIYDIVATPALGGRFDQTISNIHLLYTVKDHAGRRAILVSDENLTMLLDKGKHHVHCQLDMEGPTCGIMPMGAPAILTTKGLRWNLTNTKCALGGILSTSNIVDNELIEIETDAPVVWTIEINRSK
ncbi:Thiamin pyrophosphokinase 1 [Choanephora cucurbitarum]|uniref:Thiamine pyrophosphokinase n=1 Tax=Choanephora cucurbitarum TaxID=101091 RepID=A0A1C7N580_9FUNG|nr:Thiamin pyrophosphokinase 1 [Choanephora cucurbitarum]